MQFFKLNNGLILRSDDSNGTNYNLMTINMELSLSLISKDDNFSMATVNFYGVLVELKYWIEIYYNYFCAKENFRFEKQRCFKSLYNIPNFSLNNKERYEN